MTVNELPSYGYSVRKSTESDEYEARCVEMPDLSAYGETPDEALEEIKVAVCAWLEVLDEDGLPFPDAIFTIVAPLIGPEDPAPAHIPYPDFTFSSELEEVADDPDDPIEKLQWPSHA